ncbi:hypothetical protein FQN54_008940 [Arachnomyces sp. PD_36]|nr:hypothetical protein FQN54_008940 [Arachnomyces sp. PD_36]
MDILLGGDRHLAWDMVLEWRTIATRHVKQQFQLWLHIENNMYGLQSYPLVLDASGEITAWDSGAKGKEPEAAGPSRSGGAKRGTRDLSPRKSPSKRPQSSGGGFFKWLKKR